MEPAERDVTDGAAGGGTAGGGDHQHFFDGGKIVAKDIPDGWCRCADFDERKAGDPYRAGPAGDYQIILNACNAGTIRAYKDKNRWVVNRHDAESLVRSSKATKPQTASNDKATVTSTLAAKKPATSDVEKITKALDSFSDRLGLASDQIYVVLSQIRDVLFDLKTPTAVEQKQDRLTDY